jgi:glycosyltransferase involved in cell wall biosynthesis
MMAKKVRLLAIGHSYVLAGNRSLPRYLATLGGFEVTVAAPDFFQGDFRPIHLEPEPQGSPVRLVGLPASHTGWVHWFRYDGRALKHLVESADFDVVHAWEEPYVRSGAQLARALRHVPARYCFRTAQNQRKWYPPPFGTFERTCLARAQGWIAGGELVYRSRVAEGYPAATGRQLPLAVDTAVFRPAFEDESQTIQSELGLRPPVVGYVGRLVAAKGLDLLMRALQAVPPNRPWSLLVLGDGPYRGKILSWAESRGFADRVHVRLVDQQQVAYHLRAIDLLAVPSQTTWRWKEQFGRVLVEAFASGVPVLASDSGEIPYVGSGIARIVHERDTAGWAAALTELLIDSKERAVLAESGLRRANDFSVQTVSARYADFYSELAGLRAWPFCRPTHAFPHKGGADEAAGGCGLDTRERVERRTANPFAASGVLPRIDSIRPASETP